MNTQHKQSGSAHVVIIIILIVVVLGLLGFVFWQNFINKKTSATTTTTTTSQTAAKTDTTTLKDGQVASTYPAPLSWKYPSTWTLTVTGAAPTGTSDETASQTYTITSPSGGYAVNYQVGVGGGVGGTCGPEDASVIDSIQQKSINSFNKGLFVQSIIRNYDQTSAAGNKPFLGYSYKSAILENNADIAAAKAGSSACVFGLGVIELSQPKNYDLLGAAIAIKSIDGTNSDGSAKLLSDTSAITKAFNSSEYKDAVNILLSTTYSN